MQIRSKGERSLYIAWIGRPTIRREGGGGGASWMRSRQSCTNCKLNQRLLPYPETTQTHGKKYCRCKIYQYIESKIYYCYKLFPILWYNSGSANSFKKSAKPFSSYTNDLGVSTDETAGIPIPLSPPLFPRAISYRFSLSLSPESERIQLSRRRKAKGRQFRSDAYISFPEKAVFSGSEKMPVS